MRAVEASLQSDVARIRYEISENWNGESAIFFRVILSDEAASHRLREVAGKVETRLAERLDFPALDVLPYHNFRSESEQAVLRKKAWAQIVAFADDLLRDAHHLADRGGKNPTQSSLRRAVTLSIADEAFQRWRGIRTENRLGTI